MKVNKITIVTCAVIVILSGASLFLPNISGVGQGIISGVFTAFVASLVISVIGYFYEKGKIIDKTVGKIRSLYINMNVLSKIIGDILPQIHGTLNLSNLPFGHIPGLAGLNLEFTEGMELRLFEPLYTKCDLARVFDRLRAFERKLYNLKSISSNLETMSLEHTIKLLNVQNNQQVGNVIPPTLFQELDEMKNLINIRTAKLHEHETALTLELEQIAQDFYKCIGRKISWQQVKDELMLQIEDVVKSN